MLRTVVVVVCALALAVPAQSCRYWCRTPEDAVYCCEYPNQPPSPHAVNPGYCPPIRPACPPVKTFGNEPPITCASDGKCGYSNKCCYDRCLEEHVCKPAEPLFH